mmetsp:Transcript_31137/g.87288  ORF Transcript_31137/g.87288 Transcript_31137/m.87288 type:complete len:203 (-) Transcript_31137:1122-1730(-)
MASGARRSEVRFSVSLESFLSPCLLRGQPERSRLRSLNGWGFLFRRVPWSPANILRAVPCTFLQLMMERSTRLSQVLNRCSRCLSLTFSESSMWMALSRGHEAAMTLVILPESPFEPTMEMDSSPSLRCTNSRTTSSVVSPRVSDRNWVRREEMKEISSGARRDLVRSSSCTLLSSSRSSSQRGRTPSFRRSRSSNIRFLIL